MKPSLYPILLAGGVGARLWPSSRKSFPKQFLKLIGTESLYQKSAITLASSEHFKFHPPTVITNEDYRFIVLEQLAAIGILPGSIIIEPAARNTAPAILAASIIVNESDEDAILVVAPTDHWIENQQDFCKALNAGIDEINKGQIITFGVPPTYPETGYGYIELPCLPDNEPSKIVSFIEKPKLAEAAAMQESGNYLWNSGILMFRAKDIIALYSKIDPQMVALVRHAIDDGAKDLNFFRLAIEPWSKCENISIDYAILENSDCLSVVLLMSPWNDLGAWDSIWRSIPKDDDGVATIGSVSAIECQNTLLKSDDPTLRLVGFGLDEVVAVATSDAVLVAHKSKTRDLKKVLQALSDEKVSQVFEHPFDYRPWGWYETLIGQHNFQVKRIHVKPGESLSLQSHKFRSEHWVVVEGVAHVTVEDQTFDLQTGQSVFVPQGAIHQLENMTKSPVVIVEVQTGTYLGEDDIYRYSDKYSRQ